MSARPVSNVVLVGFGYAGRTFHAPLIAACGDLRLHTIVTSKPDEARALWPDARAEADFEAVLADPEIDLVVLATPNDLHAPQARAALEAGKAVVIDKPFALSLEEARGVADLARDRGLLLSIFHNRRWDADFPVCNSRSPRARWAISAPLKAISTASGPRFATAGASGPGRAGASGMIWGRI